MKKMTLKVNPKKCPTCGKMGLIWSKRHGCKLCSIKLATTNTNTNRLSTKRNKISTRSVKEIARQVKYRQALREIANERGEQCEICMQNPFSEHHHIAGRIGDKLWDKNNILRVCRTCHRWVHNHPKEARLHGYLK
jgi:hypothetical protein